MSLRSFAAIATVTTAAVAVQMPANAATVVPMSPSSSAFFGPFTGNVNDTTSFAGLTAGQTLLLTISGSSTAAISLTSILFNGSAVPYQLTGSTFTGGVTTVAGANNTLQIIGSTGGSGSFSGTLSVLAAVPEASSWMMMVGGFGVLGFAMRRRQVTFATA